MSTGRKFGLALRWTLALAVSSSVLSAVTSILTNYLHSFWTTRLPVMGLGVGFGFYTIALVLLALLVRVAAGLRATLA